MTTLVGTQRAFPDALNALLELDYDAIEAYDKAIARMDNPIYKAHLIKFKLDYERHVKEITKVLMSHNVTPAFGPDVKQWVTKGKVILANLLGDQAILMAMLSNENDGNDAYQCISKRDDLWADAAEVVHRGCADERRHKVWFENVLA